MDFCIKTLAQVLSQITLWLSAAFSLLVDSSGFLDASVKYLPLLIAIVSSISYIGLTRIKKKKERLEIERLNIEIEKENIDIEIKKRELKNLQSDE